jgi:hypothetical protein
MINARPVQNDKDASDLVAILLSNVGALHNQASVLSGDVRQLYGKIVRTHRVADCVHRKIRSARAHSDSSVGGPATSSQTQWAVTAHELVNLPEIGLTPFSKL